MTKLMQAACVAGAVLLSAAGCKHCCGDKGDCPDGNCPPGTPIVSGTAPGMATVGPTTVGPQGTYTRMPGAPGTVVPGHTAPR